MLSHSFRVFAVSDNSGGWMGRWLMLLIKGPGQLMFNRRWTGQDKGMIRKRVVVAGLGDVGLLTAIRLAHRADVVGISTKPALVSGQELGVRLARPDDWARDYWIPFDRFRCLDRGRTVHATLTGLDPAARTGSGRRENGVTITEGYDALVISTGVANGFWRRPTLQSAAAIGAGLRAAHDRLAAANSVIGVGGGGGAGSQARKMGTTT